MIWLGHIYLYIVLCKVGAYIVLWLVHIRNGSYMSVQAVHAIQYCDQCMCACTLHQRTFPKYLFVLHTVWVLLLSIMGHGQDLRAEHNK